MKKEELRKIVNNDYNLPAGKDEYEAVQAVISILGSADAELRDELGYSVLNKWLLTKKYLNPKQLENLLDKALSNEMLFYKIGETKTNSVFLRSFTSLLIALILLRDNRDKFLGKETYQKVLESIQLYCHLEKDSRSYVEGKGWAHAPAHIADVVDECIKNRHTKLEECKLLWNALLSLIENATEVFIAEEDERMSLAVVAMVEQGKVPISVLIEWLNEKEELSGKDMISRNRSINFKHFLRCLYFRLSAKKLLGELDEDLLNIEEKFNPFHQY
jgi:hypothetical protein